MIKRILKKINKRSKSLIIAFILPCALCAVCSPLYSADPIEERNYERNTAQVRSLTDPITSSTTFFIVSIDSKITLSHVITGGIWTSGDATIATVDNTTGTVTGKKKGTAVITYSIDGQSASVTVTVVNPVVDYLYTNYNIVTKTNDGFWESGVVEGNLPAAPNENSGKYSRNTAPDNTHELLAFRYNNKVYSTGTSDNILAQNGVVFTSGKYKALPVQEEHFTNTSGDFLFGFGDRVDGVIGAHAATGSFPRSGNPSGAKLSYILNSGKQGLNLGSVVTNIPNSIKLNFEVLGIKDPSVIGDGVPEIIITQMAQPSNTLDQVYFVDKDGKVVGETLKINFNTDPTSSSSPTPLLGYWHLDLFYPGNGLKWSQGSGWDPNGRLRPIRLWARDAADFGITPDNANDITGLVYHMGGSSDPAFLAYNSNFLFMIGAVDDYASASPGGTVGINILENDDFDNSQESDVPPIVGRTTYIEIVEAPSAGAAVLKNIDPDGRITDNTYIDYQADDYYTGEVTFKYKICDKATGTCKEATVTVTIVEGKNYWHGTIDHDWAKPQNWTGGRVPRTLPADEVNVQDVEFATASNNQGSPAVRDLHLDRDRFVRDLVNASDKDLVVTPGNQLTINREVKDGNPNAGTIVVQTTTGNDPDNTEATGTLYFNNPGANASVSATIQFYNKAYDCATCGFYTRQWQYFGIPVQSAEFPYLSPRVETVNQWSEPTNGNKWITPELPLQKFTGYQITNSSDTRPTHIYNFTGTLNVDNATVELTKTDNVNYSGMNLIANSYAAAIPISADAINFTGNWNSTVYLFNAGTRDQWRKLNGSTVHHDTRSGQYKSVPLNLAGEGGLPFQIPSMHIFMVDAESNGTLTLQYDKLVKNGLVDGMAWRSATNETNRTNKIPYIVLDVIGSSSADRVWLFEHAGTTRGFDNGWDGYKLFEEGIVQFYVSGSDNEAYQVATVPQLSGTIFGLKTNRQENYTLSFSVTGNVETRGLQLHDLLTNRYYPVRNGAEYTVAGINTPVAKRFKIVDASSMPGANGTLSSVEGTVSTVDIFVRNNAVYISNSTGEKCIATIYDIMGKTMGEHRVQPYSVNSVGGLRRGIYIVKVRGGSSVNETRRVMVK